MTAIRSLGKTRTARRSRSATTPTAARPSPTRTARSRSFDTDGKTVRQTLDDGTQYTRFDDDSNPLAGKTPDGETFTIEYDPDGSSVMSFANGSSTGFDSDGDLAWQLLENGTRYTDFDDDSNPHAGRTGDGETFTIEYGPDGTSVMSFANGSSATFDAEGNTVRQTSEDGTVFTDFDADGNPLEGTTPEGLHFTTTYVKDGGSVMTFSDGSSATFGADGGLTGQRMSNGAVYTAFDSDNNPLAGRTPDGRAFTISYDSAGGSVMRYRDGATASFDANGTLLSQRMADGTVYTRFNTDGYPVQGIMPDGRSVMITYSDDGQVISTSATAAWR